MNFVRYDSIVDYYPAMWPLLVPGYLPILNAMLDIVRVRGYRPRALLDLGCGPGSATVAVAPACDPQGEVTLVDGSQAMLAAATHLVQANVRDVVHGDFTAPEVHGRIFAAQTYDLVLCSFALQHLDDGQKRDTIENIAQSLRPGGFCLLSDEVAVDRPGGWDLVERIRARFIDSHIRAGHIVKAFWDIETSLTTAERLPFSPARIDDLTSWMARSGLAVSCPVSVFGSALLVGVKP